MLVTNRIFRKYYLNELGLSKPTFIRYIIIEISMGFWTIIAGGVAGSTADELIRYIKQIAESGNEMSVDQAIEIGLIKNHGELFPETSEFTNGISAFASDYETLQYAGFSSEEAYDIVRFIYFPRNYLIQNEHLKKEFVMELNQKRIDTIVEDSLKNLIRSKGVSVDRDLEFDIAAIEDHDHLPDFP